MNSFLTSRLQEKSIIFPDGEPLPVGRYFSFRKIIYRLPFRFASLLSQAPASLRVAFGEEFRSKVPTTLRVNESETVF